MGQKWSRPAAAEPTTLRVEKPQGGGALPKPLFAAARELEQDFNGVSVAPGTVNGQTQSFSTHCARLMTSIIQNGVLFALGFDCHFSPTAAA